MKPKEHWESIYRENRPEALSWFQRDPAVSLRLIRQVAPDPASRILDVGGGASTLVDALFDAGYQSVAVLDLSRPAMDEARARLGTAASHAMWIEGDVLAGDLAPAHFDLWHDRATFHFLTSPDDRRRYVEQARRSLKPGGHVILAVFAEDGPTDCGGLAVARYLGR